MNNPETGNWFKVVTPSSPKPDQVCGVTSDGLNVFSPQKLLWTWPCFQLGSEWCVYFSLEFNKNEFMKRRPYLVLQVGKIIMQMGWLFA